MGATGLVIANEHAVADDPVQPMRLPARLRRFVDRTPGFLKPELTCQPRPTDRETARYVRSFLIMRIVVGVLGVLLPLSLVLIGRWLDGKPWFRDSLSAYYYSGARELFVGVLSAIGVFLFTYKVTEHSLDNTLTFVAAAAVAFVVLFPTGPPAHVTGLTPLQAELGEAADLLGKGSVARSSAGGTTGVAPSSSSARWRGSGSTCSRDGGRASR